jgi:hypothetical protein
MQREVAFYQQQLEQVAGAWCPQASTREYQRKRAAMQDLLGRMERGEWAVPDTTIPPALYLWCVRFGDARQADAFRRRGYQATACDLRPAHLWSWGQGVIRDANLKAYRDLGAVESEEEMFQQIVEIARNNHLPYPTYLLFNEREQEVVGPLLERLRAAGYELVPME